MTHYHIPSNNNFDINDSITQAGKGIKDLTITYLIHDMASPIDPQQLGLELGSGAAIGGIIGFATKKIAKIVAVLAGLQLALFKFLEARGILNVDWSQISDGLTQASQMADSQPAWLTTLLSTLPIGAGFTGGFFLGFRKG